MEEGSRHTQFAFIDFRDSAAGRPACVQGSSLAVWEVILLVRSYKGDATALARHLNWPEAKVWAALNYAQAYAEEIEEALSDNTSVNFDMLKRMVPQASAFVAQKGRKA